MNNTEKEDTLIPWRAQNSSKQIHTRISQDVLQLVFCIHNYIWAIAGMVEITNCNRERQDYKLSVIQMTEWKVAEDFETSRHLFSLLWAPPPQAAHCTLCWSKYKSWYWKLSSYGVCKYSRPMLIHHHDCSCAEDNPLFMIWVVKIKVIFKNNDNAGYSVSFSVVKAMINNRWEVDAYFSRNESLHKC